MEATVTALILAISIFYGCVIVMMGLVIAERTFIGGILFTLVCLMVIPSFLYDLFSSFA